MMKTVFAYLLITSAVIFAFFRGKKQAELTCIDFNVLPFVGNTITIVVCAILIIVALIILQKKHSKV